MIYRKALLRATMLACVTATLTACGGSNSDPAQSAVLANSQAQVDTGLVTGNPADASGIVSFKGIPYAAAPVGALRWQAPQPAVEMDGQQGSNAIRQHTCWQGTAFGPVDNSKASEDCLFLNVWTVRNRPPKNAP